MENSKLESRIQELQAPKDLLLQMDSDGLALTLATTSILLGALNFLPAVALGPLVEHFNLHW